MVQHLVCYICSHKAVMHFTMYILYCYQLIFDWILGTFTLSKRFLKKYMRICILLLVNSIYKNMCMLLYLEQKRLTPFLVWMKICFKGTVSVILSELHEWSGQIIFENCICWGCEKGCIMAYFILLCAWNYLPLLLKVFILILFVSLNPFFRKWAVTGLGLGAIPFIVHPIDNLVHTAMDHTTRKWFGPWTQEQKYYLDFKLLNSF